MTWSSGDSASRLSSDHPPTLSLIGPARSNLVGFGQVDPRDNFVTYLIMLALLSFALLARIPQAPRLTIGNSAPKLEISKWVKGQPVSSIQRGTVYVIEFWAVWCGPCIAGIPHLTQIQKQYGKKVCVVGLACLDDYGDSLSAVEELVRKKGNMIGYRIAWDIPTTEKYLGIFKGRTNAAYMKAAALQSLPISVIVDGNGKIAYIGHPAAIDMPLAHIVKGDWNLGEEAKRYATQRQAEAELGEYPKLLDDKKYDEAYRLGWKEARGPARGDARLNLMIAVPIIASPGKPAVRDLKLAEYCALRAVELTESRDPGMLDCLASVYYFKHDLDAAIATEKKAIALADGPMRAAQQKNLDRYEKAKAGT